MGDDFEAIIEKVMNGTKTPTGIAVKLLAQMIDARFAEQERRFDEHNASVLGAIKKV